MLCVCVNIAHICMTSSLEYDVFMFTSHAKSSDVKENGDDEEPSKAVSTSPAPKRKQPSLKGPTPVSPLETSARPAKAQV